MSADKLFSNMDEYAASFGLGKEQFLKGVETVNRRLIQKPYLVLEQVHDSDYDGTADFCQVNGSFADEQEAVDYAKACAARLYNHFSGTSVFVTEGPEFSEVYPPETGGDLQVQLVFLSYFHWRIPESTTYRTYRFIVLYVPFEPLIGFPLFEYEEFDRDLANYFKIFTDWDPRNIFIP